MASYNSQRSEHEAMDLRTPEGKDFLKDKLKEGMGEYDGAQDPNAQRVTAKVHNILKIQDKETATSDELFPSPEEAARIRSKVLEYFTEAPELVSDLTPDQLEHMSPLELCLRFVFPPSVMHDRTVGADHKMEYGRNMCTKLALEAGVSSYAYFKKLYKLYAVREGITSNAISHIGLHIDKLQFPPHFARVAPGEIDQVREKMRDVLGLPILNTILDKRARTAAGEEMPLLDSIRPSLTAQIREAIQNENFDYSEQRLGSLKNLRNKLEKKTSENTENLFTTTTTTAYDGMRNFLNDPAAAFLFKTSGNETLLRNTLNDFYTKQNELRDPRHAALANSYANFMSKDFKTLTTGQLKDMNVDQVVAHFMMSNADSIAVNTIIADIKRNTLFEKFKKLSQPSQLLEYIQMAQNDTLGSYENYLQQMLQKIGITCTIPTTPPPKTLTYTPASPTLERDLQWYVAIQELEETVKSRSLDYEEGQDLIENIKNLKKEDTNSVNQRRTQRALSLLNNTYDELTKTVQIKEFEMKKLPLESNERKRAEDEYKDTLKKLARLRTTIQAVKNPAITLESFAILTEEIRHDGALHGHLNVDDLKLMEEQVHHEITDHTGTMIDTYVDDYLTKERGTQNEVEKLLMDTVHEGDADSLGAGRFKLFSEKELNHIGLTDEQILGKIGQTLNRWTGNEVTKNNKGETNFNKKSLEVRNGAWFKLDAQETTTTKGSWKPWEKKQTKTGNKSYYLRIEGFDRKSQELIFNHHLRIPVKTFMSAVLAGTNKSMPGMSAYTGKGSLSFVYDEVTDAQRDNVMTLGGLENRLGLQTSADTEGDLNDPEKQKEIQKNAKLRPGAVLTCTDPNDVTKTIKLGTVKKVDTHSDRPKVYFKEADRPLEFPELLFLFKDKKGISVVPPEYKKQQDKWQGKNSEGLIMWTSLSAIKDGFKEWYGNFKKKREDKEKILKLETKVRGFEPLYKTMNWKKEHKGLVDQYKGEIETKAKAFTDEILALRENKDVLKKIKEFRTNPPNIGTFEGRWKWQGLVTAILEKYGTLYPFEEMKDWEKNDVYGGFWVRAFAPKDKRLYAAAIQHANESVGPDKAAAEISRLQSVVQYNMYFGESFASKLDRSIETGKKAVVESATKKFKSKVTTAEQAGVLAEQIKNQRWTAALALLKEYAAKEFDGESMFNMFLYFFDSICYSDGQEYKSKVPYSELMDFAKEMAPKFPTPYFQVFRSGDRFRAFANILYRNSVTAKYGWAGHEAVKGKEFKNAAATKSESTKWDMAANGIPKPKLNDAVRNSTGKTTSLYNFFTGENDFSIFEGIENKAENIPNESQKELWTYYLDLMKNQALPPGMNSYFQNMDPKTMTKHVMLTSMNGDLFGKLKLDENGDFAEPSYQFTFETILGELKKLKASKDLSPASKEYMLKLYNSYIFNNFFNKFKYGEARTTVGKMTPLKMRDRFLDKYGAKLEELGFNAITGQKADLQIKDTPEEEWPESVELFTAIHKETGKPYNPRTRDNPGWEAYVDWKKTAELPWGIKPTEGNTNQAINAAVDKFIPGIQRTYHREILSKAGVVSV